MYTGNDQKKTKMTREQVMDAQRETAKREIAKKSE